MKIKAKVLIVDDEPDVREALAHYLRAFGYEVATAGDGNVALERASEFRPDLVLLDIMMPKQDGWLVCAKLKATTPAPKVVIITALPHGESDRFSEFVHSDAILHKPFDPTQVVEVIEQLVPSKA